MDGRTDGQIESKDERGEERGGGRGEKRATRGRLRFVVRDYSRRRRAEPINRGERRRVLSPVRLTPPRPARKLIGMLGRGATRDAVCSDVMLAV